MQNLRLFLWGGGNESFHWSKVEKGYKIGRPIATNPSSTNYSGLGRGTQDKKKDKW